MQGYTLAELRAKLQATRGETRVKTKEEGIRNEFLQTAVEEIFQEHDWDFNKKVATEIAADPDGVSLPADFSPFNTWYFVNQDGVRQDSVTLRLEFNDNRERFVVHGLEGSEFELHYFKKAPSMLTDSTKKVYFPQPMLIADRAYVRLKTAYFPDEDSERELALNKRELARLWARTVPTQNLRHKSWR